MPLVKAKCTNCGANLNVDSAKDAAVYGSYDSPQVLVLRRFRDDTLSKSTLGRLFIKFYYRFSPPVADRLKNTRRLNSVVRRILDKFVNHLSNKR